MTNGQEVMALGGARSLSVSERLQSEKQHLEARLAAINEAIELLEATPEVLKAIDCLSKLNIR